MNVSAPSLRAGREGSRVEPGPSTPELLLSALVAASALAIGSVHPWAYVPLWLACLAFGAWGVRRAWVAGADRAARLSGESAPLLWPGIALSLLILVQLAPLPARLLPSETVTGDAGRNLGRVTLDVAASSRGLVFVVALLALHAGAAVVFAAPGSKRRFVRFLTYFGLALFAVAAIQRASGTRLIYGLFAPLEGDGSTIFGPFVNRNHFAAYMLLCLPLAIGRVARSSRRLTHRAGPAPRVARVLARIESEEGRRVFHTAVPAVACSAALFATGSRGALLGLVVGLVAAGLGGRRSRLWLSAAACGILAAAALTLGLTEGADRLSRLTIEGRSRLAIWTDTWRKARTVLPLGTGFNTFEIAMARTSVWGLPLGATDWPPEWRNEPALTPRGGVRMLPGVESYFREAHNDYLQLLLEAGVPGLLIGIWAILRLLRARWRERWVLAGLAGVLAHSTVDFGLQIPAIALVFSVLAAGSDEV